MSLDRADRYEDGLLGPARRPESQPGPMPDVADADRPANASQAERVPLWLPTKEERIAAYWHNRRNGEAAEAAYAAAQRAPADHDGTAWVSTGRDGSRASDTARAATRPRDGAVEPSPATGGVTRSKDTNAGNRRPQGTPDQAELPSPNEGLLKRINELEASKASSDRRIAELEAEKASLDRRIAAQDARTAGQDSEIASQRVRIADQGDEIAALRTARGTDRAELSELRAEIAGYHAEMAANRADLAANRAEIAEQRETITEQGKVISGQVRVITGQNDRLDRLEDYLGQMTTAIREVRQRPNEVRPASEIAGRFRDGDADAWRKPQQRRHLPTDAVNSVISGLIGGTLTDLAFHLAHLSPEIANIGAYAASLGAGIIAVLRERRKAKDHADHRPEG